MGDKMEIEEDAAVQWIRNQQAALDALDTLISTYERLETLDEWGDSDVGFIEDGHDLKKKFGERDGGILIKVYKDARDALQADMAADLAKFHALYGSDFDSKLSIDKTHDQISGTGH